MLSLLCSYLWWIWLHRKHYTNLIRSRATTSKLMGFFYLINLTVYRYLKTVIIMSAKIEIKHLDATDKDSFIKCDSIHVNDLDEHFLEITLKELSTTNTIWLDVSTAIKFAKTLRTEINKIKS